MSVREHFILSNRKVYSVFGKKYFHIENNIAPGLPLHYAFASVPAGANARSRIESYVEPADDRFIDHVVSQSKGLKNVTLYIHGFHHLFDLSFKLDIFDMLIRKYCIEEQAVGKFIFFAWPSTQSRHYLDDRAHAQGLMLFRQNHLLFHKLYKVLNAQGTSLHLMVHSMGHRLLNGFLSEARGSGKLFNKVFLIAPDVPHKSLDTQLPGVCIRNRRNSVHDGETPADDLSRRYDLTVLSFLSDEVHCYYYRYDRILLAGVAAELKRHEETNADLVNDCFSLGNLGNDRIIAPAAVQFHDVKPFLQSDSSFGPFLLENSDLLEELEAIISANEIHDDSKWFAALRSRREPWVKLHRYFVECNEVVRHIAARIDGAMETYS